VRQRFTVQLIFLFALMSLHARADEWKKQFAISGKPSLRIETNDADIRITAWDGKDISAQVVTTGYKLSDSDVRVTDHQSGDQVEIEVHRPNGVHVSMGWHERSVRIEVRVPRDADLNLHSGDGNIRVEDVRGELRIESGDGDLEVRSADGKLNAETHDGNIRAGGRFDALDLHTGDGNIDAEAEKGSNLSSSWVLRSGDGNVVLRIGEGLAADLDASTGDGHVTVDFPVTVSGSLRENDVRGKINGGGPSLQLRTGDGDIELKRM
jgi:DUF4097 and DUF4098 domain-containing protein YvlB